MGYHHACVTSFFLDVSPIWLLREKTIIINDSSGKSSSSNKNNSDNKLVFHMNSAHAMSREDAGESCYNCEE